MSEASCPNFEPAEPRTHVHTRTVLLLTGFTRVWESPTQALSLLYNINWPDTYPTRGKAIVVKTALRARFVLEGAASCPNREPYPTCCPLVRFSHIREHRRCCAHGNREPHTRLTSY